MGGSSWSYEFYKSSATLRRTTGTSAFAYTDDIKSGIVARETHKDLNPMNVVRESRDSDEHPNSNAIAVMFDVTGSMGGIPVELQKKLPGLLGLLIRKGYIEDPQILFGAIGDYRARDVSPIQVGQFESGNEMEGDLSKIFLEGCGGGNKGESYDLAMWFFANKTVLDCYEKRGEKGYLFTIGDEPFFKEVRKTDVKEVFGDDLQADIPIEDVVAKLQENYHYFHILPLNASWSEYSKPAWADLLGQNLLMLDDADAVCETIALAIGVHRDMVDVDNGIDDLVDEGYSTNSAISAARAVAELKISSGKLVVTDDIPSTIGGKTGRL